ncbi:hydroxymethylglutaryl-CoA lyase-like protein [Nitritalea halalkaliphila LW7]|uniref:Hydroxymethylglutaryl-CoA lyase-like protein n=1 Tax=Nitritalea halalkaliphila LW7 TaxID=1189621 RepID=I5C541_9BACT|nr:hydroxymethylglutaryl-CoA lyase-like protein [Nitritalea halalkaliphila LW7]
MAGGLTTYGLNFPMGIKSIGKIQLPAYLSFMIQLVECPRDAMQGLPHFIDTSIKAAYLDQLLAVGFHTLDFGSFVSPKAIPQMRDTAEVLGMLDLHKRTTRLLAIVANTRGAEDALQFPEIDDLGFPLSLSERFSSVIPGRVSPRRCRRWRKSKTAVWRKIAGWSCTSAWVLVILTAILTRRSWWRNFVSN